MTKAEPRLDRRSLARLGTELQAAHHRSEKEPLSERQKDLLLQWAIREAVEAAKHEALGTGQPTEEPTDQLNLRAAIPDIKRFVEWCERNGYSHREGFAELVKRVD